MMLTYARFIIKNRAAVIITIVVITVFFGYHALSLEMAIERDNQLPQSHPLIKLDNKIMDLFGGASVAVIAVAPHTGTIYNNKTLGLIAKLTDEVAKLKGVKRNNVLSITSPRVKDIVGRNDTLDIAPLIENLPLSGEELKALPAKVRANEMATAFLVSEDGRTAVIFVDFDSSTYFADAYREIEETVDRVKDDGHEIVLAGSVVYMNFIQVYSKKMAILFVLAVCIVGLIHFEAFRTIQAIILPLVTALVSVVWGLGLLGYFNIKMDAWNSLTPILILAVAAGHAVQILKRYYEEYPHSKDNESAVIETVAKVGPTMFIAGGSAILGFLSLLVFDINTVKVFGLFTAFGIMSALILEMTFIPAIRSMISPSWTEGMKSAERRSCLGGLTEGISDVLLRRPRLFLGIGLLVFLTSIIGALRLRVNNSFIDAFPKDDRVNISERFINERFAGTSTINILVTGAGIDALKSPRILQAMDGFQSELGRMPDVGKIISLTTLIKRTNRAMNGDDEAHYLIPESENLISQYLLLYDPDDLEIVVDRDFNNAVIRVFTRNDQAAYATRLFSEARVLASRYFGHLDVEVGIAGGTLGNQKALNENVIKEKTQNIWQIVLIILLVSSLALRSMVAGLYVILPSILAIVINFGVMGITGTWLSLSTAAVSALTISIGADYAIYFIFRYREEFNRSRDHQAAIRGTMSTTGKGIFFVASAIAAGFATLLFSPLVYHKHLGGLVALSMLTSSLGAVTLLPAMITLFEPDFLGLEKASLDTKKSAVKITP